MPVINLSSFKGLEVVHFCLPHPKSPGWWIKAILKTVGSDQVRKITFDLLAPHPTSDFLTSAFSASDTNHGVKWPELNPGDGHDSTSCDWQEIGACV